MGKKPELSEPDLAYERVRYIRTGNYYYIAGRFATLNNFGNVVGNLLHHSIEMYLKGGLIRNESATILKDIGHNLKKLWMLYKKHKPKSFLSSHDKTILDLNKFEELRYPSRDKNGGMGKDTVLAIAITGGTKVVQGAGTLPHAKQYLLNLEAIDLVVEAFYKEEMINAPFYFQDAKPDTLRFLRENNLHPIY